MSRRQAHTRHRPLDLLGRPPRAGARAPPGVEVDRRRRLRGPDARARAHRVRARVEPARADPADRAGRRDRHRRRHAAGRSTRAVDAAAAGAREQRDRARSTSSRPAPGRTRRCASSSSRAPPTTTAARATIPAFFTEDMRRAHAPATALERDIVEAEAAVADFREKNAGRDRHRDALLQRARARTCGPSHARLLSLPAVPMIARLRSALPVHPRRRRRRARSSTPSRTTCPASTTSPPDGVLALSEVIDLLGKRPLPVLPPFGTGAAAACAAPARHRHPAARCWASCATAAGSTTAS